MDAAAIGIGANGGADVAVVGTRATGGMDRAAVHIGADCSRAA